MSKLKAPFPYFGGKSAVAAEVWRRFGSVTNYVEPFAGSCAVLLGRPRPFKGVETINDADGLLSNFWRAMTKYPRAVARWADWPVNEADLHARHLWLVGRRDGLTSRLMADPEWCDPKAAGWWAWVMSCAAIPRHLMTPHGYATVIADGRKGVTASWCTVERMAELSKRLRLVRVKVGDWHRCVKSPSAMGGSGDSTFGIFLDPPYSGTDAQYSTAVSAERDVWAWATGASSAYRIAVAGYEDGREVPEGWSVFRWSASGGYGNKADGAGRANAARECIWFSPSCHNDPEQPSLF